MNDHAHSTEMEQAYCESVMLPGDEQRERTIRRLRGPRRTQEQPHRRPGLPGWIGGRLISAGARLVRGAPRSAATPTR